MPFGQLVIGPPGSGKTTYCNGMSQYLHSIGRKVAIINLDPANDGLPYQPAVDISELVHLEEVMNELKLGPNGGLVYCIDYLQQNMDWLKEKVEPLEKEGYYFLIDCPGQVELFMMHDNLKKVVDTLTNGWHYRLAAVHLVDAHLCTDAAKYVSALLLSLSVMLHLEMPHVNVLSKIDLLRQYGRLDFNLDFYTEVHDLSYLVDAMGGSRFSSRFRKLTAGLCEAVQDFGLVSFVPLAIQDVDAVRHVLNLVDKANGAVFAQLAMQQQPAAAGNAPPVAPEFVYGSASLAADDTDLWTRYQEKYVDGLEVAERDPAPGSLPGGALSAAAAAAAAGSGHSAAAAAGASSGGPKALHRGAAAAAARPHQEHSTPQRTDEEEEELPPLV